MPSGKTNIGQALDYIAKVIHKKAIVFLVSDFIETDFKTPLSLLNKRHDVIAVSVRDRAEVALPGAGLIEFADAETGEAILVDTSSRKFRNQYARRTSDRFDKLKNLLRSINVDCINISTDKPYLHDLIAFFRMRHRRY
jgi:uncharacterized protein (DUF58 family)